MASIKTIIERIFLLCLPMGIQVLHAQSNQPNASGQVPAGTAQLNPAPSGYAAGTLVNYVRSWDPQKPYNNSGDVIAETDPISMSRTTQYIDGLGRGVQTVGWQASPTRTDVVASVLYDALGREQYRYLPYNSTASDGGLKNDPFNEQSGFYTNTYPGQQPAMKGERYFYGKTVFEASPLNRPSKSLAPGNSWVGSEGGGSEHATGMQYLINNGNDNVRIWTVGYNSTAYNGQDITTNIPVTNATYAIGTLYKTAATDEHGHAVVQYKDMEGRVVLKKVQVGNTVPTDLSGQDVNWICTYYVYDGFGQLRSVIQPKAVLAMYNRGNWGAPDATTINELCFRYEYDLRKRMVAKKVPGAGWAYLVYDQRDRPVFAQDANMRQKGQWLYTRYDALNRPVQTGMMLNGISREALQAYVDGNTGNGTATTVTNGGGTTSLPADLTVPVPREQGRASYQATNSVTFNDGFTSESGAVFTAEITTGTTTNPSTTITVVDDPVPIGYNTVPLTYTFYDNYAQTTKSYNTANNAKLGSGANTGAYVENLPGSASTMTKGMATVARVRVLENPNDITVGAWLETASFYDDKGRAVQVQADNYKGGLDIATSRYDFLNRPLCSYAVHNNPAAIPAIVNQSVKMDVSYDHAGRQLLVQVTLNDDVSTRRTVEADSYDAMGQLMERKLGQKRDGNGTISTDPLEDQSLAYNIRGWLKGMDYGYYGTGPVPNTSIANNKWFAMDLAYDWGYANSQYNGNIAGQRWQTVGSGTERGYGYGYDNANRILYADFNQNNGSGSPIWNKSLNPGGTGNIDFSTRMGDGLDPTKAYDANGNILAMWQKGRKLNTSSMIDDLRYTYFTNTNKLQNVIDYNSDPLTKLGDFRTAATHPQYNAKSAVTNDAAYAISSGNIYDYGFDLNGNMTADNNKGINGTSGIDQTTGGAITYNHLNLAAQITVAGKGTITYIYDAAGNKLEKRTAETASTANGNTAKNTVTTYISGRVYENNVLQFLGQPQGRIRPLAAAPVTGGGAFAYDYFVKDHLGNTRVVLTDEWKQDIYPVATVEAGGAVDIEKLYYSVNNGDVVPNPVSLNATYQNNNGIPNPNPSSNTTANSQQMYRLNAANGDKTGLGITLRVMAGDNVSIFGKSFWHNSGATPQNGPGLNVIATDILTALAGSAAITGEGITAAALNGSPVTPGEVNSLLGNTPTPGNKPKAYVNWILFDDQFQPVSASSGFDAIGDADVIKGHMQTASVGRNGYLYVYCSNESDQDVFFDNLQVIHNRGPLLEETHYYPFGLTMAGISYKASGSLENLKKFTGNELQHNEFSDGTGLETMDFNARMYDHQIGRFWQADPAAELGVMQGQYNFCDNSPVNYTDPLGLTPGFPDDKRPATDPTTDVTVTPHGNHATYDYSNYMPSGPPQHNAIHSITPQDLHHELGFNREQMNQMMLGSGIEWIGEDYATSEIRTPYVGRDGLTHYTRVISGALQAPAIDPIDLAAGGLYGLVGTFERTAAEEILVGESTQLLLKAPAANLTQKALDHIVARHWFTSGAKGAGKFLENTTARELRDMIRTASTEGLFRPNTFGRAGTIAEHSFGSVIGTTSKGAAAQSIRVVIGTNGNVVSAFPF